MQADNDSDVAEDLTFLRAVLNEWDPYRLIRRGAPADEFDFERAEIYQALTSGEVGSEEALAARIQAIYKESLGGEGFTLQACAVIARKIWPRWEAKRHR